MIIRFICDIDDGVDHEVAIGCEANATVAKAVLLLRSRLGLSNATRDDWYGPTLSCSNGVTLTVRDKDGAPVPLSHCIRTIKDANVSLPSHVATLFVIFEGDASVLRTLNFAAAHNNKNKQDGKIVSTANKPQSNVTVLGPESPSSDDGSPCSDDDSSSDHSAEELVEALGLHSIKVNGRYQKAYCTKACEFGSVVAKELPLISVAYPKQLVECVMSSDRLSSLAYDKSFASSSSINGVSDDDFSRYLSVAMVHGLPIQTGGEFRTQIAFYPELKCCRHSCCPVAVFQRCSDKPPFAGTLRCCAIRGAESSSEITYLYPHVDNIEFLLMPKERRSKLLAKHKYLSLGDECECPRCWKWDRDELEQTLLGAFTEGTTATDAAAMRAEFDALKLLVGDAVVSFSAFVEESGVVKGTRAARLVSRWNAVCGYCVDLMNFIGRYTNMDGLVRGVDVERSRGRLTLHRNHWRLCIARRRMMECFEWLVLNEAQAKIARSHCPKLSETGVPQESLKRIPLSKEVFDATLCQLEAEGCFVPVGHPLALSVVRMWRCMLSKLTSQLAASVQSRSMSATWCPHVNWDALKQTELVFGELHQ